MGVSGDGDVLIKDAGCAVGASPIGQADAAPVGIGMRLDLGHHLLGAFAQGQEGDATTVQFGEMGVGCQTAVEHQLPWEALMLLLVEIDEAEDCVILGVLADLGVGVAEDFGVCVPDEEGEDALLAARVLGDVMFFDQGRVAMVGDGVEIEVEGAVAAEIDVQMREGLAPAVHEGSADAGVHTAGVFRQGCASGHRVETGEERQSLIEDIGHDMRRAADSPELEGEQGADGMTGRYRLDSLAKSLKSCRFDSLRAY